MIISFNYLLNVKPCNIDELAHTIKINEDVLEKEANKNPVAVDYIEMRSHSVEKEAVDALGKNFNELRVDFKHLLLSGWMELLGFN